METRGPKSNLSEFYAWPGYQQLCDDSIKNEWANMETPFSDCKSMGNFRPQGQLTP